MTWTIWALLMCICLIWGMILDDDKRNSSVTENYQASDICLRYDLLEREGLMEL